MDTLVYILQNLHWFIIFIGVLIFFHELGHFVVAKLCGIKVLRFSFGFGPRLFGVQRGETDYCVSAFPLGGFVKMVGEVPGVEIPAADLPRAFSSKPLWQRTLVVLAGPVANLVLAWGVYFGINLGTRPFIEARVGGVAVGEPAELAGVRPGDRILAVNGEAIGDWEEMRTHIADQPGAHLRLTLERGGETREVEVVPREHAEKNIFEEEERRGRIGISPLYVKPVVAVVDDQSPAARAGVASGDRVAAVNGVAVSSWYEVREAVGRTPAGQPVTLSLQRGDQTRTLAFDPAEALPGVRADLFSSADAPGGYTGLVAAEAVVAKVAPETPAAEIGIQPGDRLLALTVVQGQKRVERPVGVWSVDLEAFRGVDARSDFIITFQRGREVRSEELKLQEKKEKDELKNERTVFVFGADNDDALLGTYTFERRVGPLEAGARAGEEVVYASTVVVMALVKMAQRKLSPRNMGSLIMLFNIAALSAEKGARPFLAMLALISVNLGLLNLLPIPVLDGGHLLMFSVEAVRRRPPSLRFREVANAVGLAILLLLMVFVLGNDIIRFVLG
jgi:regulator of sigma E protease